MENRDFRNRLRNHETKQSPEAWKQMAEMLDALPVPVEEKKDRKWLLWLLLAILLLMTLMLVNRGVGGNFISENTSSIENRTDKLIQTNTTQTTTREQSTVKPESEEVISSATSKDDKAGSEEAAKSKDQKSRSQKSKTSYSSKSAKSISQNQSAGSRNDVQKNISTKTINESDSQVELSTLSDRDLSKPNNSDLTSRSNSQEKSELTVANSDGENTIDKADFVENLDAFPGLPILEYDKLTADQRLAYVLGKPNNEIILPKIQKLYWFGSAGVSDINGAKGYYLGAGVLLDLDKVASFEVDLGLFGAKERSLAEIQKLRLLSSDLEIGITLWLHLNLIRKQKHKLSLELGPSYQYAWGAERIWYDGSGGSTTRLENSYFGFNFRGGASYTYFINDQSGIGVKGAFAIYDAGYVALKYYKRI